MRERTVDAQAARRAGQAAKTQRVARARAERAAAHAAWVRADRLLAALRAGGGSPAQVARARAERTARLAELSVTDERLAVARANRAERRAMQHTSSGADGSLRAELAAVGTQIQGPPDDDRSDR